MLVLLGIAGVVAESVVRRTREIGVRIAIGARPSSVVRLVVQQIAGPVVFGLIAGTATAIALGRFIRSLLFEVQPADPVTLATVVVFVVLAALVAAWMPARRAARIDPVEALRTE